MQAYYQRSIHFISWICSFLKYLSCVLSVCQAVFSQSEGLEGEASETHYYYPVTDATQATMVENVQAPETLLTQSTPTGQLKCHSDMSQLAPCPILQCWHICKTCYT